MGKNEQTPQLSRRGFIWATAATAGGSFFARGMREARAGHGPSLQAVQDQTTGLPLLLLPPGFSYVSMSWTGDLMTGGARVPSFHDGGACFLNPTTGNIHYVRNCEGDGSAHLVGEVRGVPTVPAYDEGGVSGGTGTTRRPGGGTTTVVFDPRTGTHVETYPSLSGTRRNCQGGIANTMWLTAEENLRGAGSVSGSAGQSLKNHGFIFPVDAFGVGIADPIKKMGRRNHEAAVMDSATGTVYLTEDNMTSGFYRYLPTAAATKPASALTALDLYDGKLQMLKIKGRPRYDTSFDNGDRGRPVRYDVEWVDIDDPSPESGFTDLDNYKKGLAQGGATFRRGEGIWFEGDKVYFCATRGGNVVSPSQYGWGQVWEFNPRNQVLTLIFTSQGPGDVVSPDNLCVRPGTAGIVLCEDNAQKVSNGAGGWVDFAWDAAHMRALSPGGHIASLAVLNKQVTALQLAAAGHPAGFNAGTEWTGASFTPDGKWLLANAWDPGITFAITGDWASVGL